MTNIHSSPLPVITAVADGNPVIGKAILAAAVVLWLAGYLLACRIWPFKPCRRCDGNGKIRSPSRRAWRRCPRCAGTGGRLRTGRRLLNYLNTTRKDAND